MKRLNNKGFAITGILYTLFILFILLMFSILNGLQSKKQMLEKSTVKLEESFKLKDVTNDSNVGIIKASSEEKALVAGKYTFEVNTNNIPLQGLNSTNGSYVQASSTKMQYSINEKKEITVNAIENDGWGIIEGVTAYLESGKTYYFSCETTGSWAQEEGESTSDSVEVYIFPKNIASLKQNWINMTNNSKGIIPNVNKTGYYFIRLDVNQKGKTYEFKNLTITSNDDTASAFTYLAKGASLSKNQIEFIPNDWNDYKNNYEFKLTKIESFESEEIR